MAQTHVPVVRFRHDRIDHGQPRYVLVDNESEAAQVDWSLGLIFGEDPSVRYGYSVQTPDDFLAQHPGLTLGSEDEYDLDNVVRYDDHNPEHRAWMDAARAQLRTPTRFRPGDRVRIKDRIPMEPDRRLGTVTDVETGRLPYRVLIDGHEGTSGWAEHDLEPDPAA
jgi:hypothetical protein